VASRDQLMAEVVEQIRSDEPEDTRPAWYTVVPPSPTMKPLSS
jgi:hypothetical protein